MTRENRLKIIREIESKRKSRVLVYITGDRRGLETKISVDTFPFISRHISQFDNPEKIDLFLYSTGGITMAGYSLVNMIREYTNFFGVLIPFKSYSCATLITLGANDIIMSKVGQLSPIDPSFPHPLGPQAPIPGQPGATQPVPVSVEDIFNYIELARNELKIRDPDSLERLLENLTNHVHPLILGHGYRMREQASFLARNLLSYHKSSEEEINEIVDTITRGRFSHDYIFNRNEALNTLKLPVIIDESLEKLVIELYNEYQEILRLADPYSSEDALGTAEKATRNFDRAIIESDDISHVFRSIRELNRQTIQLPQVPFPTPTVIERTISEGWIQDNNL